MKNKILMLFSILGIILTMIACGNKEQSKIVVTLDWAPNTNHTGLYVALEKGYFKEEGIEVEIVQPPEEGAATLVASGKAQFGIDFQDYMAPAFATDEPLPVTAVGAILQHNTSGIISLKDSGMDVPKGMSNKTYATWDLPTEKAIIRSVVESDGGDYDSIKMVPSTVTDIVTALNTDIDAVWVYYGWDGVATEVQGLETDFFAFKDINPTLDYYSPILIANNEYLKENPEETKIFLKAVTKGYEYAIDNPEEAGNILFKANPELDKELVLESQKWISAQYRAEEKKWGYIDQERWDAFYNWLYEEKLIENEIPSGFGFTNDYLP